MTADAVLARRVAILEAALVAPQPLLDAQRRLVGARIGVRGVRLGVQRDAGIEMDRAFGAETEALLLDRDVARIAAVEILGQRLDDAGADALAQGFADVEILSRDAKRHRLASAVRCRALSVTLGDGQQRAGRVNATSTTAIMLYDAAASACFSRRRCTDDGIRIASRYFATVRRAMSMPASRSCSTMVSSDSTSAAALGIDQLLDAVAHRFGRMRLAAVGRRDRGGEEIFQLEDAAAGRHVFVGGDARDRRFVHADRVGDGLQIERPQVLDAVREERVLLAHDLGRDLEDRLGALIERADQPGRGLQAVGEIGLLAVVLRGLRDLARSRSG